MPLLFYRCYRLAIEATSRTLYGNVWNDVSSINVYDLDSLQLKGSIRPAIDNTLPKEIQGMVLNAGCCMHL